MPSVHAARSLLAKHALRRLGVDALTATGAVAVDLALSNPASSGRQMLETHRSFLLAPGTLKSLAATRGGGDAIDASSGWLRTGVAGAGGLARQRAARAADRTTGRCRREPSSVQGFWHSPSKHCAPLHSRLKYAVVGRYWRQREGGVKAPSTGPAGRTARGRVVGAGVLVGSHGGSRVAE